MKLLKKMARLRKIFIFSNFHKHNVSLSFPRQIFPSISFDWKTTNISFYEAPEKKSTSKDFQLHPHKNSDIIKFNWSYSPTHMIFYSIKILFLSDRECCRKENKSKISQMGLKDNAGFLLTID